MNDRNQKLAAKLKENLKRRKAQARALQPASTASEERVSLSGKALGKGAKGERKT